MLVIQYKYSNATYFEQIAIMFFFLQLYFW